ncbi:unnamed protein product [Anisakis simplex]|uniref:Uncharacterized protein n=1 Tax=Anisakis simplex TaxID=6269 RepID=A0A0M3J7L3_ANISI|nr:unnamed protein product [Anisakis simplex]
MISVTDACLDSAFEVNTSSQLQLAMRTGERTVLSAISLYVFGSLPSPPSTPSAAESVGDEPEEDSESESGSTSLRQIERIFAELLKSC